MKIDTHSHYFKEYYDDLDKLMEELKDTIIIVSGTNDENNIEVLELCNKYNNVFGTLGIHPGEIDGITENSFRIIEENINHPKIIGIGEIGLDYHYGEDRELQKKIFLKQLDLAQNYNKTVVIHSRDAMDDTYLILQEYKNLKKVMHCYNYDIFNAKRFIELDSLLGIGGIITFNNNIEMVEVVKNLDLKHILLETDSPFLTPAPFRGKRNDSSKLEFIAEKIAQIKGISKEVVYEVTSDNAIRQFDLKLDL